MPVTSLDPFYETSIPVAILFCQFCFYLFETVLSFQPDVNMPPTMSKFVQKGDVCISPLSSFDKAKRSISDLYEIIERLVAEFHTHLSGN